MVGFLKIQLNLGRQVQSRSNFPAPSSVVRPSRNVPGVNPYRTAPKIVLGVGLAANLARAGSGVGDAKFDDDKCPASNKEQ